MKYNKISYFSAFYQFACVIAALALVIWCIKLYLDNEDVSTIYYKKFHSDEDSRYPSISLCFSIVDDSLIDTLGKLGVNYSLYHSFLKGDYFSEKASQIPYENITFNPADYLLGITMTQEYGTNGITNKDQNYSYNHITKRQSNLFNDFKLIDTDSFNHWYSVIYKCLTIRVPHIKDQHLSWITIVMKKSVFAGNKRPRSIHDGGLFLLAIGYPNQRLRFSHRTTTWKSEITNGSYNMKLQVRGMEVIQHRDKSSEPCNNNWKMYDQQVITATIQENKCIPSYWKNSHQLSFPPCSTSQQMKNFYMDERWNKHIRPCRSMTKISYSLSEYAATKYGLKYGEEYENNHFTLMLYFPNEYYKEIKLVRAIDITSLIGNSGGYIGLCLGYTILQIPSLLAYLFGKFMFIFKSSKFDKRDESSYEELEKKVQFQEKKIKDLETRENWIRSTLKGKKAIPN